MLSRRVDKRSLHHSTGVCDSALPRELQACLPDSIQKSSATIAAEEHERGQRRVGKPSRRLTTSHRHRAGAGQGARLSAARGHQGGGLGHKCPTPTHLYEKVALLGPQTGGGPSAPAVSYSTPSHRQGCALAHLGPVTALCLLCHNQLSYAVHCHTWHKHGESGSGGPCTCLPATSSTRQCGGV